MNEYRTKVVIKLVEPNGAMEVRTCYLTHDGGLTNDPDKAAKYPTWTWAFTDAGRYVNGNSFPIDRVHHVTVERLK